MVFLQLSCDMQYITLLPSKKILYTSLTKVGYLVFPPYTVYNVFAWIYWKILHLKCCRKLPGIRMRLFRYKINVSGPLGNYYMKWLTHCHHKRCYIQPCTFEHNTIDSLQKTAYHVKIAELFRVKISCLESCTFIMFHGDYFFPAYA